MRKLILKAAVTASVTTALALVPTAAWAGDVDEGECADVIEASWLADEPAQPTITQEGGVYEYNGVTETYYSSQVLYHWQTPEWWEDDEGFWRTDEGYYVVANDAHDYGEVIETSKGLAQVLDGGCGGNVDFYTTW